MRRKHGGRSWRAWGLSLLLAAVAGCAAGRSHLEQALLADRSDAARGRGRAERYVVHCPDVLEFSVPGRPGHADLAGPRRVGPDGRVVLSDAVRVDADGRTAAEIAGDAAAELGLSPGDVGVRVAEYNSQQLFVYGEVVGLQRAVPFQGDETVLDLLQRVGGVAPGAAVGDVQVVRAHVADGSSPEVFAVDLEAIVLKHDQRTNVRLEPFDQIYVGQSQSSRLKPCVPPWLRPFYDAACGMRRPAR